MRNVLILLTGLSVLGFVLAVIGVLLGEQIIGVSGEAFSRASSNLALIVIASTMIFIGWFKEK